MSEKEKEDKFTTITNWSIRQFITAEIDIPVFQRTIAWSVKQRIEFIKSLKKDYPTPSILLYQRDKNKFALIDGLQRYSTIKNYNMRPLFYVEEDEIGEEELDELLNMINKALQRNSENSTFIVKEMLKNEILKWFKESTSGFDFNLTMEFSKFLNDTFNLNLNLMELDTDLIAKFIKKIDVKNKVFDRQIPVVIYSGSKDELPNIFEKLNTGGTQLGKYDILSVEWQDHLVKVSKKDIIIPIKRRYELTERISDLLVQNLNKRLDENQKSWDINLFEYLYGLEQWYTYKYPYLFQKKIKKLSLGKDDEDSHELVLINGYTFNLFCLCLKIHPRNLSEQLSDNLNKFKEISVSAKDIISLEDAITNTISIVNEALSCVLEDIKLNQTFDYSNPNIEPETYHKNYQIYSIIAYVFNEMYLIDGKRNIMKQNTTKKELADLRSRILAWYFYDIIEGARWAGAGDQKAFEDAGHDKENSTRYDKMPNKQYLTNALKKWFNEELTSKIKLEASRTSSRKQRILLRYLYATNFVPIFKNKEYHMEHLITFAKLKESLDKNGNQDYIDESDNKIPIYKLNHIANISLLESKLNIEKGSKTIIEYYEDKKSEAVSIEVKDKIHKEMLDTLKFTFCDEIYDDNSKEELLLVKLTKDIKASEYVNFLQQRFEMLIDIITKHYF